MTETFANTSADRYVRAAAMGLAPGYFLAEELSNISTLRKDRPFIPEREIVAAYLLRTHFPDLSQYANRLFARGLSAYQRTQKTSTVIEPEYEGLIQDYWQLCSPLAKLAIAAVSLYHSRPWRKEGTFLSKAA